MDKLADGWLKSDDVGGQTLVGQYPRVENGRSSPLKSSFSWKFSSDIRGDDCEIYVEIYLWNIRDVWLLYANEIVDTYGVGGGEPFTRFISVERSTRGNVIENTVERNAKSVACRTMGLRGSNSREERFVSSNGHEY